jgi:alkylated DNA repair dioxygenase AlkB
MLTITQRFGEQKDVQIDSETLNLIKAMEENDKLEHQEKQEKAKRRRQEDESLAFAMQLEDEEKLKAKKAKMAADAKKLSSGKEPAVIFAPLGVVILKRALGEDEQLGIIHTLLEMSPPINMAAGYTAHMPLFMYNWPSRYAASYKPKVAGKPTHLLEFGQKMYDRCAGYVSKAKDVGAFDMKEYNSLPAELQCPMKYKPEALYAICYGSKGALVSHQDGQMGWVLGLSMGESCDFFFSKTQEGGRQTVKLESGDLILFNGQTLFHGVSKIHEGSAPAFWSTKNGIPANVGRINLQYRDPSKIT